MIVALRVALTESDTCLEKITMMGHSHVIVGACVVALGSAAGLLPWSSPGVAMTCAGLIIAGSDWPDIDHRTSTVTTSWGPVTKVLAAVTRFVSHVTYRATRAVNDPVTRDPHRTLTHTVPGAAIAGVLVTFALVASQWAAIITLAGLIGAASRAYKREIQLWGAGAGAVLGYGMWPVIPHIWWAWWTSFTVGCLTHVYSDCVTKDGAPLSWPFLTHAKERPRVEGESPLVRRSRSKETRVRRWHSVGPPQWMRFYTGGKIEVWVVRGIVVLTLFLCYLLLVH